MKNQPKTIEFRTAYSVLVTQRFAGTMVAALSKIIMEAIAFAGRNQPPLWYGKFHEGKTIIQVIIVWHSKRVWVGLDPDSEFDGWLHRLTAGLHSYH